MNHKCPLSGIKIADPCKVYSCMYNFADYPFRCAQHLIGDAIDNDDPLLTKRKRPKLSIDEIHRRIQILATVDQFLEYARSLQYDLKFRKNAVRTFNRLCTEVFPFTVDQLDWSLPLVYAATNPKIVAAFNKELTPELMLGFDPHQVEYVQARLVVNTGN